MKIQYTCHRCRTIDREVEVEARQPDEELMSWMEKVQAAIGEDHASFAPYCHSDKCDLKLPLPKDAKYVGEEPKQ